MQRKKFTQGGFVEGDQGRERGRPGEFPVVKEKHQALETDGKTDRRGRFAAQFLDQPIVTPPGRHRVLGPEITSQEFKCRPGIVVQSPDQAGIDLVLDADPLKQPAEPGKMVPALHTEGLADQRGRGHALAAAGIFAVQDP